MIFIIIVPIIFLDQLTKFIISSKLALHESLPIIRNIFHLTLVHNSGAAFGIFKNQVPIFIVASLLAVCLIYRSLTKDKSKGFSLYSFSLGLIFAGALGNLIDRIIFGYVIDFLDFRVWPVFNLADSAITIGAVLLSYCLLKPPQKQICKSID